MNNVMKATGYAVVCNSEIDMRTVGPTRRAAIVNWLYIHGLPLYRLTTDEEIEAFWDVLMAQHDAICASVEVSQ